MKRRFILFGFTGYKQMELIKKGYTIVKCITGNPNFPEPKPAIAAINKAVYAFENAVALTNSKATTALRKKTRTTLTALLRDLAKNIDETCDGDVEMMESSGFSVNIVKGKIGMLDMPQNLRVILRMKGLLKLRVNAVKGAKTYNFDYALITNGVAGEWKTCSSTKTFVIIKGLTSLVEYVFRVAGVGAYPDLLYSEPLTTTIL